MGIFFPKPLSAQETSQIIARKLDWILEACRPQAVVLFGSAARGEMTERSDVDLALVFPDEGELRQGRKALFRRPPPDSLSQDILFFTKDDFVKKAARGGVCEVIQSEGRTLFGALP